MDSRLVQNSQVDMKKSKDIPPILDTDNKIPVIIPLFAAETTILKVITHFLRPNAVPASRQVTGTIFKDSSVVRATIGNIIRDSAKAPAHTEKCPRIKSFIKSEAIKIFMWVEIQTQL